jgi:hypothetical protein
VNDIIIRDLIERLFLAYIKNNNAPDILSIEFVSDNKSVIRLEWFSGKVKDFGYTPERFNRIWDIFNHYWREKMGEKVSLKK